MSTTTTSATSCKHCGAELPPKEPGKAGPARSTCDTCKRWQAKVRTARAGARRRAHRAANPLPRNLKHKPGDRFGSLVILERLPNPARAVFRCDCGNVKELRLGNVTKGYTLDCADRSQHPDPRRAERPTYNGAHRRVRAERGPAKDHACIGCGEPAQDWAYLGSDPDQLTELEGREAGMVYSVDPDHYAPLCRAGGCHRRYDTARAKAAPKHAVSLAHVAFQAMLTS